MKEICSKIFIPATGFCISFMEVLLTSVYDFQMFGFALSFIVLVMSTVYLYQGYHDYKLKKSLENEV